MPAALLRRSIAGVGRLRGVAGRNRGGCALAFGVAAPTHAQGKAAFQVPYTGTLKKINDSGVLRIGYRENSPPFAFLDPRGRPVGYALDLCEIVVAEIVAELGKDIRVEYRPVTPENRFDLVNSGAVDLECGSTTNNVERRKIAAFSPTMFVTGTKLLVRRASGIRSFGDLQGKTVVVTRGTVHETAIPKLAERRKLAVKFITGGDHNESFKLFAAGNADAFANDDVQLYGMLAETKTGAQYRVVGRLPDLRRLRADAAQGRSRVRRAGRARLRQARRQPRDRRHLRQVVPEAAAFGRAAQSADEPAPRGGVPGAGAAERLSHARGPAFPDCGTKENIDGNPERPRSG